MIDSSLSSTSSKVSSLSSNHFERSSKTSSLAELSSKRFPTPSSTSLSEIMILDLGYLLSKISVAFSGWILPCFPRTHG